MKELKEAWIQFKLLLAERLMMAAYNLAPEDSDLRLAVVDYFRKLKL